MQALHHKLDVVLVQIMRYNCYETDYSFCEDSPPAKLRPLTGCGCHRHTPSAPTIFCSAPPVQRNPKNLSSRNPRSTTLSLSTVRDYL